MSPGHRHGIGDIIEDRRIASSEDKRQNTGSRCWGTGSIVESLEHLSGFHAFAGGLKSTEGIAIQYRDCEPITVFVNGHLHRRLLRQNSQVVV